MSTFPSILSAAATLSQLIILTLLTLRSVITSNLRVGFVLRLNCLSTGALTIIIAP